MAPGSEIITLQFGHYSNYIGAHWWNIQEANFIYDSNVQPEINFDVLFREGQNSQKLQTFTPRLLLTDLKGSLKSLPSYSVLYEKVDANKNNALWDENSIEVNCKPQCEKNEFLEDVGKLDEDYIEQNAVKDEYELNNKVDVWSDYLSTVFHPRTINIINEYKHKDEEKCFTTFPQGTEMWKTGSFSDEWTDKCRAYVEECDSLQGFQILFDCFDGNGGLTCSALEYLKDEYSSKGFISFPTVFKSYNTRNDNMYVRAINNLLSFGGLIDYSSVFVPLSTSSDGWLYSGHQRPFSGINYTDAMPYHTAAILASFLDTATLSYRKRKSNESLTSVCAQLSPAGRISLAGSLSLPFATDTDRSLLNILESQDGYCWTTVTPRCQVTASSSVVQNIVLRGLSQFNLFSPMDLEKRDSMNPVYYCNNAAEMFSLYLQFESSVYGSPASKLVEFNLPMNTSLSFPKIFQEHENPRTNIRMQKCVTTGGLHNCNSSQFMLSSLYELTSAINLKQFPQFIDSGLELLDYTETLEKLISLSECY